jgi:hypothetical protein
MSFSNVSVFRSAYNTLNTTASKAVPESINKGGAFSPNTFESVAIMRSELDNQWDNGYIIKYQALMQNRLNRLRQDLTNAYKALLELSTVQQVRENGLDSSSAVTDVYGRVLPDVSGTSAVSGGPAYNLTGTNSKYMSEIKVGDVLKVLSTGQYVRVDSLSNDLTASIDGTVYDELGNPTAAALIPFANSKLVNISSNGAFKGLTYFGDETDFQIADGLGDYYTNAGPQTNVDGVPSYWVNDSSLTQYNNGAIQSQTTGRYEMRKLFVAGPAMQITNTMKTTFRTEEVPPKQTDPFLPFDIGGEGPFQAGSKVAEYSAEVKTGAFWSAVNYLYNFSPRELQYSYATAYSTTTEEAGTRRNADGSQATLFDRQITDARDMQGQDTSLGTVGMNESDIAATGALDAYNHPPSAGSRIKWVSSEASDGYLLEKSAMWNDTEQNRTDIYQNDRFITRRTVATESAALFPNLTTLFDEFNSTVKDTWLWSPDGSKQTQYGTEEAGVGDYLDRIKWESQHDGTNAADIGSASGTVGDDGYAGGRDANVDAADKHVAKAAYINHYTVAVQDVELNSSNNSYGIVKALAYDAADPTKQTLLRSNGIDGSAEHVWSDENNNKVVDNNSDEKLLLAGSGKISKNFDGKFVERLHQIKSFNGQNVATNTANVSINTQNDGSSPVVMAEYEGFRRADTMTKGLAEDYFSEFNSGNRTLAEAEALAKKAATEINAIKMVDTDWHYSDYTYSNAFEETAKNQDSVMFRSVKSISYNSNGTIGKIFVDYNPDLRNTNGTGADKSDDLFKDVNVAFRKSFTLTSEDFQNINFNHITGITASPALDKRDVFDTASPSYTRKPVLINVSANGIVNGTFDLVVNGYKVTSNMTSAGATIDISPYLKEGDNVIGAQMTLATGANFDGFKLEALPSSSTTTNPLLYDVDNFPGPDATIHNAPETARWIDAKISTIRRNTGDKYSEELNSPLLSNYLSSWQSKLQVERQTHELYLSQDNFREPQNGTIGLAGTTVTGAGTRFTSTLKPGDWVRIGANDNNPGTLVAVGNIIDDTHFTIANSPLLIPYQTVFPPAAIGAGTNFQVVNKAMDAYKAGIDSFGSERTVTRVKDTNSFAKILSEILNKKEYQDVFALGLLNTAAGKTLTIKAQVSSPTGGNMGATMDIQYDARNNKFVLAQTKLDAFVG